jgi:transposase
MIYVGLDHHKSYSQVKAVDESGKKVGSARLPNNFDEVSGFFKELGEPCKVVLEAGWSWGRMYDWLAEIHQIEEIQLAHPFRVKAIASAQVKTDSIDAETLAQLLRTGMIPKAHIPCAETRRLREIVRQRLFLVRIRTMVKNRIHALLDRYHAVPPPMSDLFGKRGRDYLRKLELPSGGKEQLEQDIRILETLCEEIKETESFLKKSLEGDRRMELLLTVPGLGPILAAVVALEIDDIQRFPAAPKLVAYAGLVPTTHASGGHVHHGRLMKQSNKWLRWALIEASWVAIRNDPYFRTHFSRRRLHKGAQTADVATARRLCEVIWHVLKENRAYEARPPKPKEKGNPRKSLAALIEC